MTHETATAPRVSTGVDGLDEVLAGGLPERRIYLIQGDPGVGKTTLALQFLREGVRHGERCLYITLSETAEEIQAIAQSHGWSLEGISLYELTEADERTQMGEDNTLFDPSEIELRETMDTLLAEVDRIKPTRVVFDSLSEVRLLAQSALRYRRQILALKRHFIGRNCTVLLLDDRTSEPSDMQLQSLAHGVLSLEQTTPEYGVNRRRLRMIKLRGVCYRGGYHDFSIVQGGLVVYPRLVAAEHHVEFVRNPLSSGVPAIDTLLGGGLDRGTSTLIMGPAGTGKSALAACYAVASAQRGERAHLFTFDEGMGTLKARAAGLGMDLTTPMKSGLITIQQIDPAEMSPGEFTHRICARVEKDGVKLIIIDSLNGYMNAMPEERFLMIQLHELLSYLSQRGATTIMLMAQHGFLGAMNSPVDVSYLADTVLLMRYFEAKGAIHRALSVVKKRSSNHEQTIREFHMGADGIRVGKALSEFRGVLTGVPTYEGAPRGLLKEGSDDPAEQ